MSTNRTWTAQVIAVLLTLVAVAGCTQPDGDATPSTSAPTTSATTPPPSSPTPTVDPSIAEAEELILEAYRGYWAAKVASFADPTQPQDSNLAVYAIDTALTDAQATLFQLQQDGIRLVGEPALEPSVNNIVLEAELTAEIADCVDSANWTPLSVRSGEPVGAPDQSLRVQASATAYFYDGRWTIRSFVADRDAPC